jgi:hypothetical protein
MFSIELLNVLLLGEFKLNYEMIGFETGKGIV